MNIGIPVEENMGLDSKVCAHFGSAPTFLVVDADSGNCRAITNNDQNHDHGQCLPLQWLQNERIDTMIVGGIGLGALNRLHAANIRVHISDLATVAETIAAFKAGALKLMQPNMACAHHGHDHCHS